MRAGNVRSRSWFLASFTHSLLTMIALLRGGDARHVVEPGPAHLDAGLQLHARTLVHEVAEQRVGLLVEHRLFLGLRVGDGDQLHVLNFMPSLPMKAVKIARLASPAVMAMRLPLISSILVGPRRRRDR